MWWHYYYYYSYDEDEDDDDDDDDRIMLFFFFRLLFASIWRALVRNCHAMNSIRYNMQIALFGFGLPFRSSMMSSVRVTLRRNLITTHLFIHIAVDCGG